MNKTVRFLSAIIFAAMAATGCSAGDPASVESAVSPAAESSLASSMASDLQDLEETETAMPVYANQIKNGTYSIAVSSSSSMFRVVDAQLTVADEEMTAILTLSGVGYEKLYMGTSELAAADTDENCIYFKEDAEGNYTYEVPVAALNEDIDVAAWSIRKETWYDRVLVFESAQIPEDALAAQP